MAGITVMAIDGLIARAQRDGRLVHLTDGTVSGLAVNASKTGRASWYLRYWFKGKQKEITIGRYPELGLSEAREKAVELRKAIKDGVDVASEKQARKKQTRIQRRDEALKQAMLCQVTDWLSTWWKFASDERRAELFKDWQQSVANLPGASKWQE